MTADVQLARLRAALTDIMRHCGCEDCQPCMNAAKVLTELDAVGDWPTPELRFDERHKLDDVVIPNVKLFRMERMDKNVWWMRLYMPDGKDFVFHVASSGREISIIAEIE